MSANTEDHLPPTIKEAYRLSELKLASQYSSALAADARAVAFSGLSLAAAAILCGLAKDASVPAALLIGSGLLVLSAALAGYSARPIDFYMPGAKFSDLNEDIENKYEIAKVITEIGEFNDKHIEKNNSALSSNANYLVISFRLALVGIVVAVVPQFKAFIEVVR